LDLGVARGGDGDVAGWFVAHGDVQVAVHVFVHAHVPLHEELGSSARNSPIQMFRKDCIEYERHNPIRAWPRFSCAGVHTSLAVGSIRS
jgi:hypothetical protein